MYLNVYNDLNSFQKVNVFRIVFLLQIFLHQTEVFLIFIYQVHDLIPTNRICIMKYVGYTPKSSDVRTLLTSICTQILVGLGRDHMSITRDFKELQKFFLSLLQSIPQNKKLLIFLDAVEQILPDHNAHLLTWLPQTLMSNVKIILSVNSGDSTIAQKLCNGADKKLQIFRRAETSFSLRGRRLVVLLP